MSEDKKEDAVQNDGKDAIHPKVDEGLKTLARWVAEDIMRKVGMENGERKD